MIEEKYITISTSTLVSFDVVAKKGAKIEDAVNEALSIFSAYHLVREIKFTFNGCSIMLHRFDTEKKSYRQAQRY